MEVKEEMKGKAKNGMNKTAVLTAFLVALILGLAIVGYGYMDYQYKKQALEQKKQSEIQAQILKLLEQEGKEEQTTLKQEQLQGCLDEVSKRFSDTDISKIRTMEEIRFLFDVIQKQKDECFKKYPVE